METRFRSGSCVLVILFCVVGFCGFGSVSCGENRRPKNVQVAVRAKWEGTPILLEAGELLSKERKDIYWEFIDSWLHSQKEDDDSYTAKDCLKKIMKHGHALLSDTLASLFDFSLILRSASPRLVLYRQLAEESLSSFPLLDDSFSNNASGGLAKTNDTNEMKRSDPLLVQRNPEIPGGKCCWVDTGAALFYDVADLLLWLHSPTGMAGDSFQQPELFDFDHVHFESLSGSPVTILYGALGTDCFKEFHSALVEAAKQALYHVLGVAPAYQGSIGPALNELCLGLQPEEVAPALYVYAKDVHVRKACLNAIKCIPAVASRSVPENVEVATSLWIALHDPEKLVAEAAEDIWDRYGHDFGTNYSGLFKALSHIDYNVRLAAAEALAAALDENPDTIQESLSTLFSLYIRDAGFGEDTVDAGWLGRQGIALALHSAADVLRTKDLPVVMTFLISRALGDLNADVRGRMINAGIIIIDKHGRDNVSLLFPIFENYLNKKASDEEKYDLVREGVVIFTGALAKHLAKDDPKVHAVVEKLLDVLNNPSEAVQRAVSFCLSPLMQSKKDDAPALVSRLLDQLMNSDKYGERRGAAFGLAGVVKGYGISCSKKYGITAEIRESLADWS